MPSLTPSILRVVKNVQRVGLKNAWRQLNAIGDIKGGRLVGTDMYAPCTRALLTAQPREQILREHE